MFQIKSQYVKPSWQDLGNLGRSSCFTRLLRQIEEAFEGLPLPINIFSSEFLKFQSRLKLIERVRHLFYNLVNPRFEVLGCGWWVDEEVTLFWAFYFWKKPFIYFSIGKESDKDEKKSRFFHMRKKSRFYSEHGRRKQEHHFFLILLRPIRSIIASILHFSCESQLCSHVSMNLRR